MTELVHVDLGDYAEKIEAEGSLDVRLADGSTIRIRPPELWPDEADALIDARDAEAAFRAILGDESYDRFMADPRGSHKMLNRLILNRHELTLPES